MRIAIAGAGQFGQYLACRLAESDRWNVCCYVDDASGLKRDLPVIPFDELGGGIEGVIVAISDYYVLGDVIMQLHDEDWTAPLMIARRELWEEKPDISIEELCERYIYQLDIQDKAVLTKLEYHVCDICNLNCKGCSHFAPIFRNSFSEIDDFRKDIKQLASKFSSILRLRLMGGEPFLHKDLPLFILAAREAFPYAHLEIVTNGLLLETTEKNTLDIIKVCDAILHISLYPPTYEIKDRIKRLLEKEKIPYIFGSGLEQCNDTGVIEEFHKNLTISRKHDPRKAAAGCMGNQCHYLRGGRISKCALPLLAPDMNQYFGTEYIVEPADLFNIYDESLSAWEIAKGLNAETPFCGYCVEGKTERFSWSAHGRVELADYIVEESRGQEEAT